ncbi:MAG TPA: MarR family transcriptional regulator [Symbiobacteriaceae bacterium]|nr:MarR family transcriptional regulator [Symbiobacteriaceae bacterium]
MAEQGWLTPYLDRMEELSRRFFRHFHSRIEEEGGLSPSQYLVLKVLDKLETLTVSDLAARLDMTVAGATGLLDRLVRAGLVERERDLVDRRVVRVTLSEEGRRQLQAAAAQRRAILADFFGPLTREEVAQLVAIYEKVAHKMPAAYGGPESRSEE